VSNEPAATCGEIGSVAGAVPSSLPGALAADGGATCGAGMTGEGIAAVETAGASGGRAAPCGAALTVPSRATMKLVLHFGQRIFMPFSGMRRSSTSYGDLHETHSTLIMFLRPVLKGTKPCARNSDAQQDHVRTRE
jgi:hypothetical protein